MKKKWIGLIVVIALALSLSLLYVFGPVAGPMPLWMSILPPVLAIVMALLIKEVISSLFVGSVAFVSGESSSGSAVSVYL